MLQSDDPFENAIALYEQGISLIPLNPPDRVYESKPKDTDNDGKHPATKLVPKWKQYQEQRATEDEIVRWFSDDCNIGVITGKVSNGLWVADFDDMKLLAYVNLHFDKPIEDGTFAVKTGNGVHLYFRSTDTVQNVKFCLKRKDLEPYDAELDIKGEGGYVVGPGSIHWSGKRYTAMNELPITTIGKPAELIEKLRMHTEEFWIVKACLPAWTPNHRHDATLGIAAFLKSRGWPVERTENVFEALCIMGGSHDDWERDVKDTYEKEKANYHDFLDPQLADALSKILPLPDRKKRTRKEIPGVKTLAEGILARYRIATDRHNMGIFLLYRDGVYTQECDEVIQDYLTSILGEDFNRSLMYDVREYIRGRTMVEISEPPLELVCVANGIVDITSGKMMPHSPDYFFRSKLPAAFDPNARCPKFDKFLSEILDGNDALTIQEMFGYCLYRSYPIAAIFMHVGSGSNGKSTLLSVLRRWLGEKNVATYTMQSLIEDRFAVANLRGKLANIFPDLSDAHIFHTAMLKAITGNDAITARQMHVQKAESFISYAKLIYSTNRPPVIDDPSNAMWRRIIEVDYRHTFVENASWQDTLIREMTTPEEMSGILNWAIEGLRRLVQQRQFSNAAELEERRKAYLKKAKSTFAFIQDAIEPGSPEDYIEKAAVYTTYMAYCRQYGYFMLSQEALHKELKMEYGMQIREEQPRVDGKRLRVYKGLKWNEEFLSQLVQPAQGHISCACARARDVQNSTLEDLEKTWGGIGNPVPPNPVVPNNDSEPSDNRNAEKAKIEPQKEVSHEEKQGEKSVSPAIERQSETSRQFVVNTATEGQQSLVDSVMHWIAKRLKDSRGENMEQTAGHLLLAIDEEKAFSDVSIYIVKEACELGRKRGILRERNGKWSAA
jgi:putative DNA primase/helicase